MHELLTVSSHTQKQSKHYHLPSCMSTVSTSCTYVVQCAHSSTNFEHISILRRPHPSMQVNTEQLHA